MINKKTQTEVDWWESLTHVYVHFGIEYVFMEGKFTADELSKIANLQRKRLKELLPAEKSKQKELFDD